MELDLWQKEVIDEPGNICVCSGRQAGKSTAISIRAGNSSLENSNHSILIISAVERQALLLFEKVLSYLHQKARRMIMTGKDKPTKHEIKLKNGSIIRCLPTGQTGYGIRGYTINDLYAYEAHFIPEEVWAAVTPMLATTGGRINLLSTPDLTKGKEGYFYRCSFDKDFRLFSISSPDVAEHRSEPQRTQFLNYIEKEKSRLSSSQFAAEYLGKFVDAMMQFYSNEWIDNVCILDEKQKQIYDDSYLGVDIAGMGRDYSTFEALGRKGNIVKQISHEITSKTRTTETTKRILQLNDNYDYTKIGIDSGGMGVGVFDQLMNEDSTKRKTVGLNNSKKVIDTEGRTKSLLKEDMYNNLLVMGERGEIQLFNNDEIKASLRSIHSDPAEEKFRLMGQDSHITEGIIRAAYLGKEKSLSIMIYSIKV